MAAQAVAFRTWANSDGVSHTGPIEQIKGARIAIDAEDHINNILALRNGEPLLPALGGLPFGLHKRIREDLQHFRDAEADVIFVFGGLDVACRDRASKFRESRKAEKALSDAWSTYDGGRSNPAVEAFGRTVLYRAKHIMREVYFFLHKQGAQTMTAPYIAAPQLVHMERTGFCDVIAGSASVLVWGAEKVVTEFDWDEENGGEKKTVTWVTTQRCTTKLGVTSDQFVNICLLSGASILPILPELDDNQPTSKIPAARNFVTRYGPDTNTLVHNIKDESYRDNLMKALTNIKHPVIVSADGKIEPVNWENGPSDTHFFASQRLPDEALAYLIYGLISPRMLDSRTRGELIETQPLDGGQSEAYQKLVQDKLRPIQAKALALITRHLHRYYQKNDVEMIGYWNEANKLPLNISDLPDASPATDKWHVTIDLMGDQPSSDALKTPLSFALNTLSRDDAAKKTVTPRGIGEKGPLQEVEELNANTVFRFLQDRGYINSDHTLSAWGKALKVAIDRANSEGLMQHSIREDEIEDALLMAFELLRLDVLNSSNMFPSPPYSFASSKGSNSDRGHILLVSRIACLASFHHAEIGYTGPLLRHMLAYHQMAAAVRETLRDLLEMHACSLLMSNSAERRLPKKAYKDWGASLPLLHEPDVGLGLIVKTHLDEQLNENDRARTHIKKWFKFASDLEGDLAKAWKLWAAVNAGIQAADSSIISSDTKSTFQKTDAWLAEKIDQPRAGLVS